MGTATVGVWITEKGHPCRIDNSKNQLYVYVLHCNGQVLEWCGKKYVGMRAKCGYLELKLPVGCYVIGAVENPEGIPPLGNHLSHIAIVRVNCGDRLCVTLFYPTLHNCGHWFLNAMQGHLALRGRALPNNLAGPMREAIQAVDVLLRALPTDDFTKLQAQVAGAAARTAPDETETDNQ
jgi:hypothetical protein